MGRLIGTVKAAMNATTARPQRRYLLLSHFYITLRPGGTLGPLNTLRPLRTGRADTADRAAARAAAAIPRGAVYAAAVLKAIDKDHPLGRMWRNSPPLHSMPWKALRAAGDAGEESSVSSARNDGLCMNHETGSNGPYRSKSRGTTHRQLLFGQYDCITIV